ncbi:MAG: MucR family transcriptional regulator [Desulfurivibrio sp.]|nr:MucR family transcriptional regulator [Desulfurivibrio sp.]
MSKTLVELAAELVQSQCATTSMTADEVAQSLQATYNVLLNLQRDEARGAAADAGGSPYAEQPGKSIQKHKIVCLECGEEFKMISPKHLRSHGLTGREYRRKWGLPLRQALCARELSERRKKAGKERGLPANLRKAIDQRSRKSKSAAKTAAGAKKVAAKGKTAAKS